MAPSAVVSAFFAKALRHYPAFRKQRISLENGFGAWTDERHPDRMTPEDTYTYVASIRAANSRRLETPETDVK